MLKTSTSSVSFDILLDAANLSSGHRFGHEFDSCCFGSMGLSLFICCSTRDLKPSLSYFFLFFSCLFLSFLSLSFPFSFFLSLSLFLLIYHNNFFFGFFVCFVAFFFYKFFTFCLFFYSTKKIV